MARDLPLPEPSKESDIPENVRRARALVSGEACIEPPNTPSPKRPRKVATGAAPTGEAKVNLINITVDGADFNLVMPCSGVDIKTVHGQDTETLALGSYRFSTTRFSPKTGAKFRITPHASGTAYDVTFMGFSFDVGDIVIHAFVIDAKYPTT